jgi:hypothetical protein
MTAMCHVQAEGATRLAQKKRVRWMQKGMHVLRRGGKHTWRPVTADWQIEEAKGQIAAYHDRGW